MEHRLLFNLFNDASITAQVKYGRVGVRHMDTVHNGLPQNHRTLVPSIRAIEDSSCHRLRGHCDRLNVHSLNSIKSDIDMNCMIGMNEGGGGLRVA
jgi:hypothetical protein